MSTSALTVSVGCGEKELIQQSQISEMRGISDSTKVGKVSLRDYRQKKKKRKARNYGPILFGPHRVFCLHLLPAYKTWEISYLKVRIGPVFTHNGR